VEALAYSHGEGLVHGHLKPANIMAVGDELKLSVDGISLVGESGVAPGAPGPYDPPEFRDRGCSPVGDVWSFGMTLVEALTQQLPTVGGPKQEPVLPATLPAEFLPMVRACLRPDPRRRASLYDILAQFERPAPAEVEEPAEEPPAAPRRWLSLALVGASAVALAGILVAPRLLHHPPVSAATEQAVVVPASTPVATPPEPARPSAFSPAAAKAPPVAVETAPPPPTPRAPAALVDAAPGQVLHQVLPEVTDQARSTIRGKVKIDVRASVDPAGRVTNAAVESQNSRYFANLTVKAVEQWSFEPREAASEWLLQFELTPSGTTVHPSRVSH
jgi:serine/threonine protein kinase